MHPIKYVWAFRALIYKPFFKYIGGMTYIGKSCFLEGCRHISIGKRTRIFPGIRMEAIGTGEIIIGNNCAIEQNVHITSADGELIIGNDVTILANTYITNLDHNYEDINLPVLEQGYVTKDTKVGDGCFIGFGAAIQAGTVLGKHCIVGAHSVVKGTYHDYSVIVGAPARTIKRYNYISNKWENATNPEKTLESKEYDHIW